MKEKKRKRKRDRQEQKKERVIRTSWYIRERYKQVGIGRGIIKAGREVERRKGEISTRREREKRIARTKKEIQ